MDILMNFWTVMLQNCRDKQAEAGVAARFESLQLSHGEKRSVDVSLAHCFQTEICPRRDGAVGSTVGPHKRAPAGKGGPDRPHFSAVPVVPSGYG